MPKYTFICKSCENKVQLNLHRSIKTIPCKKCKHDMQRQLPTLSGASTVKETIDPAIGTTWIDGQKEAVKERHDSYFWTVEVPRMVQSGVYSIETMLEQGWIWFDDDKKMHIHNKPPHKR